MIRPHISEGHIPWAISVGETITSLSRLNRHTFAFTFGGTENGTISGGDNNGL